MLFSSGDFRYIHLLNSNSSSAILLSILRSSDSFSADRCLRDMYRSPAVEPRSSLSDSNTGIGAPLFVFCKYISCSRGTGTDLPHLLEDWSTIVGSAFHHLDHHRTMSTT